MTINACPLHVVVTYYYVHTEYEHSHEKNEAFTQYEKRRRKKKKNVHKALMPFKESNNVELRLTECAGDNCHFPVGQ